MNNLYTIGSSGKNAEKFFGLLSSNNVTTLIDVRLNNTSQLSGFTKKSDLKFFLDKICKIGYLHLPIFAPTEIILKNYKTKKISWNEYEKQYINLIYKRDIERYLNSVDFNSACLLCSENSPEKCHRRLAAEFIKSYKNIGNIIHLI